MGKTDTRERLLDVAEGLFADHGLKGTSLRAITAAAEANPAALREIAERLLEAEQRGLWQPRSNSARAMLDALAGAQA